MKRTLLIAALLLLPITSLFAQRSNRVNYVTLLNRASTPEIFIDHVVLPTEDGETNLAILFRFNNDFLPYKRISASDEVTPPEGMNFFTIASLNAEIFEGKAGRGTPSDVNVASRDRWADTLYTATFEETESEDLYASGSLQNTLKPGAYHYVLQLSLMENTNERTSQRRNVVIPIWEKKESGEILLADLKQNESYPMLNLGDNVYFGKDFNALIRLPHHSSDKEYTVRISRAKTSPKDTTKMAEVYEGELSNEMFITNVLPELSEGEDPLLTFRSSENGYTYAAFKVPNSDFENAGYILEVTQKDSDKVVASTFFRSYWRDMPASLLNLDIAIDHLKFIVGENQLKELKSGNAREKEEKFRTFWEQRDPTPGTVYNELMAEYYRRIEYAFREFSNRGNMAGHESDQGEVYIKFGPPISKDRQFPNNGKVIEIWEYKDRKFVFEATTGFGDFVLLGKETD